MPFQSEKQRRFLWAVHPDIAKRWAHEYPNQKNLPTYAHKSKKTPEKQESDKTKEAQMAQNVTAVGTNLRNTAVQYIQALTAKYANSAAVPVEIPHSEKPVSAGEEHVKLKGPDQEGQLLGQMSKEQSKPPVNETLHKLAVVLSQVVQQHLADQEAAAQGQEAQQVPQNVNLPQYSQPASATPLPMGMAQAQAQQMQQAMPGAAPQQAPVQPQAPKMAAASIQPIKPMYPANHPAMQARRQAHGKKPAHAQLAPVGNGNSPNASPINSYSGLSQDGDINGNAAFGTPNSAEKLSAANTPCSCGCGDTVKTCKCGPDCKCRKPGGSCYKGEKQAGTPAWQRAAGKNEEGGLNEKGRKSYEREHGGNLKAPVTESNPKGERAKRQNSFCSRMCGMKRVNTGASTAKDPDSRINKSLRKWNCKCSAAMQFGVYIGRLGQ